MGALGAYEGTTTFTSGENTKEFRMPWMSSDVQACSGATLTSSTRSGAMRKPIVVYLSNGLSVLTVTTDTA